MTTTPPATAKQIDFINSLASERDLNPTRHSGLIAEIQNSVRTGAISLRRAQVLITELKTVPRKPVTVAAVSEPAPANNRLTRLAAALKDLPNAKYAVELPQLSWALRGQYGNNDLMFVRIREYRGRKRIVRLLGAPGAFSTIRIDLDDAIVIAGVIGSDPLKYTQMYAEHYSVCGRCDAELTDEVSRAYSLGPTCRKAFGLTV